MTSTLFWHDYETFGADPSCDRISQFAGIRTDLDLNIIGDPLCIYCQPPTDILPHPEACFITGITPQLAQQKGLVEKEFIARIHQQMIQPQTCSLGYNSIRFDDELTRFTLFRNFYDPYEREWKNGNSRWDIIDMVRLVYALKPETLHWPAKSGTIETDDFVPSFKLEQLAIANNLNHDAAHDALSDVIATIELAKLIKTRQPKLYDYCWNLRQKKNVSALINWRDHKPLFHISSKIPASRSCSTIVMPLMPHPTNSNGVVVIDLSVAPESWVHLSSDVIKQQLYMRSEELNEKGLTAIPIKTIHINRSPIVATTKLVDDASAKRMKLDKEKCSIHWHSYMHQHNVHALTEKLKTVFDAPFIAHNEPEQSLYNGGFLSSQDKINGENIRNANYQQLSERTFIFEDKRFDELLWRYKARNYYHELTLEEQQDWHDFCQQRLNNPSCKSHLSWEQYKLKLEQLKLQKKTLSEADQKKLTLIEALTEWGNLLTKSC